uniref:Vacuolar protein sorting 13 homolog C n=1 Tax=Hippocampus comes TaxID=109280 RepID=A0A3Q3D817_HIPCM
MVFEALVSDLLNRFIGDYVENLDKSQLKIGIWGNVVLENLRVKENALSEFDLPFKVKAGQIGTLTLKIPWKNLYNDAVVATLDGLYLLVVPGAIKYDAAKEERDRQEAKQRELQRIEDALRMAARRKPEEEKKDSFMEKLATQVIKNLQVKISSIHLRYEDDVSDPQRPLSMGVTLAELSLQTTDESWKLCILNEATKIIHKLGRLECLCAYWNVNSQIFYRGSRQEIVFKPIFASAKIRINPNAEQELDSPKAQLHLEVQNIDIQITKPQYVTMVEMLESVDRMVKNAPYRKFRPDVPVRWRYAFSSILEVHIRRSSHMWSWSNIRRHRQQVKTYKTAYKSKVDLEKILDVFNITLARQQAHMEVVRSGQKVAAKKASGAHKQGGFFSGFFARKPKKEEQESEEMTAEEKEKLYAAIGYSGSSHNLALPKQYVAVELTFQLLRTSVTVRERARVPQILQVQMIHLSSKISQRPGAQALVEAALRQWSVTGLDGGGGAPSLISSAGDSAASLLRAAFELNPDDSPADHLVRVHSQPVQIIYDAMTVNSLADFFKMGKGVELEVLTSATLSKLEEIKEKTATLSHIIETRKVLDLKIDLQPSYLLLPKDGFYSDTSELIVVDFGNLQFNSVDENARSSSSSFSSLEEIMERAYERYSVELRRVQVLYSKSGQHILRPLDLTLHVSKCMVDKDVRMPRLKLSGELPLVHVKMSDEKIRKVAELLRSIPLPRPPSAPATPADKSDSDGSEMSPEDEQQRWALEELTDLEFKFEVKEVLLELTRQVEREKTVLALRVWQLGAQGKMRTFDTSVTSYLRRIALDYCLHLIGCSEQHHADLLKVDFIKADPSGPGFPTLFGNTEQSLKQVAFSSLDFLLDAKALLSTMDFLSSAVASQLPSERSADARKPVDKDRGRTSKGVKDAEVFSLKLLAVLGCFHVELCDDRRSIADIRVQGMDASVLVQAKQTEVFARLRDIVVTDVDPKCIHKKAVSIVGEEVFSFKLCLFPGATEGDGYKDTSKADAKVTLRLGCIRMVYLHRFLMSLLMFADNFHTAKEAVSAATAQAAEKAASGVRHLAHKSFRLLMDIRLKAPLIVVPQSSGSRDAVLVDLGLITVSNSFGLTSAQGFSLPAVVDKMDIRLTQLKLSDIEILEPINVELVVTRNTASSWFAKIPGVHVQGVLRSLKSVGEEDLGVLTKVLLENIGEGQVTFSSLDLMLHTQALLSTANFLSGALSSGSAMASPERTLGPKTEDGKTTAAKSSELGEIISLKVMVALGAFNVLVCDQSSNIADIKIQLHGSLLVQGPQTYMSARLKDFAVLNVDPASIHKKAISIVGDEVFSFSVSLTPKATEGSGYADTSKTDGRVKLNVGCIRVVYLHKLVMALLNFANNFQTAKAAVSAATAQAAERAASSVRDLAEKSFRLSTDIKLKAPLIVIPQSSASYHALVMDLGLITVSNSFDLLPIDGCPLPAVIDNMDVQLTQLKLSNCLDPASGGASSELLEPVNLKLRVSRNLAASWYNKMAAVEVDGDLKPMKENSRLGEFALHLLKASGKLWNNGSMEFGTILTNCTLDDQRSGMDRVTSMVSRQDSESSEAMIDVVYRQSGADRSVVAVLHKLYVCASVEFLMAVADFFLQALPRRPPQNIGAAPSDRLPLRPAAEPRSEAKTTSVRAVIVDPQVVFVASLMKADAPSLLVSFQCDFNLQEQAGIQTATAQLRALKVLACPLIHNKEDKAVTTQISPFILNTVSTIVAAMTARQRDRDKTGDQQEALEDLWLTKKVYACNYWFLGVDQASEMTENFREMKTNPAQDMSPVHGDDFVILPEPRVAVNICSGDALNVTLSRCGLNVFSNLAKQAFSEGAASTFDPSMKEKAPFTILNALGVPLIVQHSANLRPVGAAQHGKLHELPARRSMDLEHSVLEPSSRGKLSALQRQESCLFHLTIPAGFSEITNVPVDRPGRRLYNIRGPELQQAVSLVVQVDAADGNKLVTVRSPLQQIHNHFSVPFSVLKFCPSARSLQPVGLAHPEKEFHIPLDAYRCQLYVCPASDLSSEYGPSSTCVSWKEEVHRSSEVRSLLQCPPLDAGGGVLPLMVSTLAAPDTLNHIASRGEDDWDPAYVLHLHPVATLRNLLPYTLRYMMENCANSYELAEGSTSDLLNARLSGEIMSLVLLRYQGRDWHGHLRVDRNMPEFLAVCLTCDSDAAVTLDLSVHAAPAPGRLLLSVFSPFWIINKTRRVLQYRAEDVSVKHPADLRDIVLFSFRRKNILSKNKSQLQLCVSTSSWSDGFSLDTVGSCGCVRCPGKNKSDFLVGVSIRMSSFALTKMVTMSPFYTLVNKSSYELEVGEPVGAATKWHYVPSAECLPLWPESTSGKLCVRAVGSERASQFFFFDRQDNGTLLNQCGGITVDVNVSDHSSIIGFGDYYEGAAPALLLNHTPWADISYKQKPGEVRRFAWDDPAGVRTLSWSCSEHSGETDLLKDEVGQFSYDSLSEVHWVSFLDGRQRVLIFTEDVAVVTKARQAEELEQYQLEVRVSLQNLGLSLVDSAGRQEVAYVGIPSGVVWEMRRKNRWKPLSQKHINLLEKTYQSVQSGQLPAGWTKVDANLEQVNLGAAIMMMRQPFSCPLRRNFLSGIQVEFKRSRHQRSLRAQLHWLQVDNQLPGAIFPIAFHPVPPPKSIALDSPKPFIDVSVITRFNQHSSVTQFYFMALVQEMAVKIDQGFLSAILALFTPAADPQATGQKSQLIQKDVELLQAELMESSLSDASGLNFFEHFHISPIKLHLSLSLGSSGDHSGQDAAAAVQSLNLLLKSIGATLTDVDDLVFLAYFEVKYRFYRREKLMRTALRHYSEQFLKQMYVLVLGLDVLGNPFGLIRGLSEGVEAFFYEPFQGAVQGPEEFAEGFVIGVRSLLGHTVGAAGVVSRITGSVGKGLAAITMDKEYQQKRREEMNRTPKDFGGSLAKGGKGLLKGVVSGVTGIVTKPVEAKKEGAAGFFKGIGKGLVGAVARPTGSIVDMASSTFQGIQAAESTEDVSKLRPVRLIREDGIIRPYDLSESQGFDLFQQRSELKQLEGEVFRDQCPYPGHRKTSIIVTNRVVCVKEMDFVGHFNKDWECLFENF